MNISDSLDQYADICRDVIKKSSAKLNKSFENLLIEILLLYMIIPRKINFTQMDRVCEFFFLHRILISSSMPADAPFCICWIFVL